MESIQKNFEIKKRDLSPSSSTSSSNSVEDFTKKLIDETLTDIDDISTSLTVNKRPTVKKNDRKPSGFYGASTNNSNYQNNNNNANGQTRRYSGGRRRGRGRGRGRRRYNNFYGRGHNRRYNNYRGGGGDRERNYYAKDNNAIRQKKRGNYDFKNSSVSGELDEDGYVKYDKSHGDDGGYDHVEERDYGKFRKVKRSHRFGDRDGKKVFRVKRYSEMREERLRKEKGESITERPGYGENEYESFTPPKRYSVMSRKKNEEPIFGSKIKKKGNEGNDIDEESTFQSTFSKTPKTYKTRGYDPNEKESLYWSHVVTPDNQIINKRITKKLSDSPTSSLTNLFPDLKKPFGGNHILMEMEKEGAGLQQANHELFQQGQYKIEDPNNSQFRSSTTSTPKSDSPFSRIKTLYTTTTTEKQLSLVSDDNIKKLQEFELNVNAPAFIPKSLKFNLTVQSNMGK